MNKLVLKQKAQVITEYDLENFHEEIAVGSEDDNDIVVQDRRVSMNHLLIEKKEDGFYIKDLRSAFGTCVNGNKIGASVKLNNGDRIDFGNHTFICHFTGDVAPDDKTMVYREDDIAGDETQEISRETGESMAKTRVLQDSDTPQMAGGATVILPSTEPQEGEPTKIQEDEETRILQSTEQRYLLAIYGPYLGNRYALDREENKIGRDHDLNDIIIRKNKKGDVDTSISRRHATILVRQGKYFVSDKRSKTRTYVNKNKLGDEDEIELKDKDEIEIVSDMMSTILRFVKKDDLDFSYPKKAGVWWVRLRPQFLFSFSIITGILLLLFIFSSFTRWQILTQVPKPLQCTAELWIGRDRIEDGGDEELNRLDQTTSPAIADVNGDGHVDLIMANHSGHLIGIDCQEKRFLWEGKKQDIQTQAYSSITLEDMDLNGLPDIVISLRNSRVLVYDGIYGQELSNWRSEFLGDNLSCGPILGDLDNNGYQDVVVCSENGGLHIGYVDATNTRWQSSKYERRILSTPLIADLTGDNQSEVLFGTENGKIIRFNPSSSAFEEFVDINLLLNQALGHYYESNNIRSGLAFGLIGDRDRVIVSTSRQYRVVAYNANQNQRLWVGTFESMTSQLPDHYGSPVMGDLTGDGNLDVVVAYHNGEVKAYDGSSRSSQEEEPIWRYRPEREERFIANPALADFTKDGIVDVVIGGMSNYLYVIDGSNGKTVYESRDLGSSLLSTPLVGDIDGNSTLDILVHSAAGNVYKIDTNSKIIRNTVVWGQDGYNASHINSYPYVKPDGMLSLIQFIIGMLIFAAIVFLNVRSYLSRKKLGQSLI